MTPAQVAHELALTASDLTRACAAHELYFHWLCEHGIALGSAGIANYLLNAAFAFEEQAHALLAPTFDPFVAREDLSDILMACGPLTCEDLRSAVTAAISEAGEDLPPDSASTRTVSNGRHVVAIQAMQRHIGGVER